METMVTDSSLLKLLSDFFHQINLEPIKWWTRIQKFPIIGFMVEKLSGPKPRIRHVDSSKLFSLLFHTYITKSFQTEYSTNCTYNIL